MLLSYWPLVAALALLPLAATAEQKNRPPDPSDASAAVPPLVHASAFKTYQTANEEKEAPDQVWRTLNDEMRRLGGHAGHVKGGSAPSAASAPAAAHQHHAADHHSKGKQ